MENFLGYLENIHFQAKSAIATFWATILKNWDTFCFGIWSHWLWLSGWQSGRFQYQRAAVRIQS